MMVNASRNVLNSFPTKKGRTFSYHGSGYTYHLHKTATDIWAKLQIARKTMQSFLKNVGLGSDAARKLQALDGLSVCEQGVGGWYEVFVLDERKLFAIINFIKKLNRFMHGANHPKIAAVKSHHYFIEARKFEHTLPVHKRGPVGQPPTPNVIRPVAFQSVLQPPKSVAPNARLATLATVVNSRYGH